MTIHLRTRALAFAALASFAGAAALWSGACGGSVPSDQGAAASSSSTTTSSGGKGTGGSGAGGGKGTGGSHDCYTTPTTYVEIINACTTAQEIDVSPVLPLLEPDGGLPPLP